MDQTGGASTPAAAGENGATGLSRTLARCAESVKELRFYEALQQYKAMYVRYSAKKKAESTQILEAGAILMVQNHKFQEGLELGTMLVDHFRKKGEAEGLSSEKGVEMMLKIAASFQECAEPAREYYIKFLTEAVKWSRADGKKICGDPRLHQLLAVVYDESQEVAMAHSHFARGNDASQFVGALKKWCVGAKSPEIDLFLGRAVLQSVCAQRLDLAEQVSDASSERSNLEPRTQYLRSNVRLILPLDCIHSVPIRQSLCFQNPNILDVQVLSKGKEEFLPVQVQASPVVNLCKLLISACRKRAPPLFELIQKEYTPTIRRDPMFSEYMRKIGEIYFEIKPPNSGMEGLLSSLFGAS